MSSDLNSAPDDVQRDARFSQNFSLEQVWELFRQIAADLGLNLDASFISAVAGQIFSCTAGRKGLTGVYLDLVGQKGTIQPPFADALQCTPG